MDIPDLSILEETAKDIVHNAKRDGTLSQLTVRIIREKIEVFHGLGRGKLDAKEYKHPLKSTIQNATKQVKRDHEQEDRSKSDSVGEHVSRTNDGGYNGQAATKPTTGKRRRNDTSGAYKSAEFIECSDVEDLAQPKAKVSSSKKLSPRKEVKSGEDRKPRPPHKRRKVAQSDEDEDHQSQEKLMSKAKEMDGEESGSEMSSLFGDEPSKPTDTSGAKISMKKPEKEKAVTKPKMKLTGALSKDEATIKRLKSFVTACGVRKPWAKVFKDCPRHSQQIQKLKELLAELGMTGRLSMEQAKQIKEKRELAQELEDVQSFEQHVLSRSSQSRTTSSSRPSKPEESESEESEELQPTRRQSKALQSINAFLEDQSDSD